jgi:fatty-acyl-CoA synthase
VWRSRTQLDLDLKRLAGEGVKLVGRAADEAYFARVCFRAGVFELESPQRLARIVRSIERHGLLASSVAIGTIRHPDRVAIRDDRGDLTYRELYGRANALANAWRSRGVRAGDGVTMLIRNHRGFLETLFAAVLLGTRVILLNTSFAGPQIRDVAEREGTDLIVYDDEFGALLEGVQPRFGRFRAWVDDDSADPAETLDALIAGASTQSPPKAKRHAKLVILTSGTTGAPKGAPRDEPRSLAIVGGLLSRVPLRAREATVLATPMFHTLGLAGMALGFALGSTLVVHRRFDPELTLDAIADNRATALIVVPVMLQRIVDLGQDAISRRDLSALRVVLASGSALGPSLVARATTALGPVVYNLYGSTEIAQASIATPDDLALDLATVGRPVRGTVVKIFGDDGRELPAGETGRIFVGNYAQFEGYSGGGRKDELEGLMSSGDVGHFDERGLLFIDGRDDEMIVSGGENVFPGEIEDLLAGHDAIVEAAAIGVGDERFGQRLRAFVVLQEGHRLSEDEVRAYVRDNLATYKVPRDVVFVAELPRNPTGKVLKRELATWDA